MLAQTSNRIRLTAVIAALALSTAASLTSCATKQEPQLVNDGAAARESSIPWNHQEKWETQGQFANMTDRR